MKKIYLLRKLVLKGASFTVHNVINVDEITNVLKPSGSNRITNIYYKSNGQPGQIGECHYYTLSLEPVGVNMDEEKFLPYFADVIEDLPSSCRMLTPTRYPNCQLTTQHPGGYLVFHDHNTGKDLKIAMNSHYYQTINN
jgi:hypothetical protein